MPSMATLQYYCSCGADNGQWKGVIQTFRLPFQIFSSLQDQSGQPLPLCRPKMGLYSCYVLPWLCDFFLDIPAVTELRRELLAQVAGDVLEIGFGTGLNLPHYPAAVRRLTVVDPNAGMHQRARKRISQSPVQVTPLLLHGDRLPIPDGVFDCVVSTFTLCSIEEVDQALAEVHRVLKPQGRFLFLEHGRSPDPKVQAWQSRLNGLQKWFADGCRLNRDMRALIGAQPYSSIEIENFYLESSPRTHGYIYRGTAMK